MISRLVIFISLIVVFAVPAAANSFVQKRVLAQFLTVVRDMHPSVLGAGGTGQLLAREMPVIMNRLRETRNAIANVGTDYIPDGANNETIPFAFIEDANDRRTLIRYIDDYTYLLNQLDAASAFNDRSQIAEVEGALERKSQQMKRLVGIWGRKLDGLIDQNQPTRATINPISCGERSIHEKHIAEAPPSTFSQSEKYTSAISGTWVLDPSNDAYTANWQNGANAKIDLIEFVPNIVSGGFDITLFRQDPSGVSSGLTACYTGVLISGRVVNGQVNWVFSNGRTAAGTWEATAR